MPITVAKAAGFCFGVERAVEIAFREAKKENIYTLGEIIHNPQIVSQLHQIGAKIINYPSENTDNRTIVIRSHGVGQDIYDAMTAHDMKFIDATCPFVAKIHKIVKDYFNNNDIIIIVGDKNHPEVIGIKNHCRASRFVVKSEDEMSQYFLNMKNIDDFRHIIVTQTTFNIGEWKKCIETAKKMCTNLIIFDTICCATTLRQNEAMELAKNSDIMLVIGGKNSSNTAKLAEVCSMYCKTLLVEDKKDLQYYDFRGIINIGITAGASTPACIIKEVQQTMSEILSNDQEEMSFEEMLDASFKTTYTREKVTGIVTAIKPNEVVVDIGTKHAGYIPLAELTDDPNAKPEELVKVGDSLELIVVRLNDVEGTALLSKKRLDAVAGFEKVMNAADTQEILEGVVVEVVKSGVLALTNGVRVFIPASQATASKAEELESLLKKNVSFKILEVNRGRRRAVGSIRAVLKEQRKELEDKFWETAEVGNVHKGTVKSITSYGAFVDLGGIDGMVHISELSWSRIKHPSDVVKVGDVLEVYIREMDTEKKKISLGFKKSEDNPWSVMDSQYGVGTVTTVKIVSLTAFGAFAQVIPGVDGLIHISQISTERINRPADVLTIGQEVQAKIIELDTEKKRVSLSMRALVEEQEVDDNDEAADETSEAAE